MRQLFRMTGELLKTGRGYCPLKTDENNQDEMICSLLMCSHWLQFVWSVSQQKQLFRKEITILVNCETRWKHCFVLSDPAECRETEFPLISWWWWNLNFSTASADSWDGPVTSYVETIVPNYSVPGGLFSLSLYRFLWERRKKWMQF